MQKRMVTIARYAQVLKEYDARHGTLLGLRTDEQRQSFAEQILDSVRRVEFVRVVRSRGVSSTRADPDSDLFDPVRAAIHHLAGGDLNESAWLVFLSVHFGKNRRTAWSLVREVYRGEGPGRRWNWERVSTGANGFRGWLDLNQTRLRACGSFGNHRKYTTLHATKAVGTGAAVASYIDWIGPARDHKQKFDAERAVTVPFSEAALFDRLYHSLEAVVSFGRMARFDYLTMLGKVGVLDIEPGRAYLTGATGPLKGARLMFGRHAPAAELEALISDLARELMVGQQVMEDSICNWQKSPDEYRPFRG